jgi:hypothetical protein
MADHSRMKLGKQLPKYDPRTLRLAKYLHDTLPLAPPSTLWTGSVTDFGMMLNDVLGNCTIAGGGHQIQVWTLNTGSMVTVSDSEIRKLYGDFDGYIDGDQSTDNGGVEIDVLNQWRQYTFAGHTLLAYADPDPGNLEHIKQSISVNIRPPNQHP